MTFFLYTDVIIIAWLMMGEEKISLRLSFFMGDLIFNQPFPKNVKDTFMETVRWVGWVIFSGEDLFAYVESRGRMEEP